MADGKKPQKGGKRPEVNTMFEIPDDIYAGYCTSPEEDKNQRKVRIQKIERRWAREWREYRYVKARAERSTRVHWFGYGVRLPSPQGLASSGNSRGR